MWSQYSDSQINIAEAVLMFSTVSWVSGHRVSGVECFGPQRTWWGGCLKTECIMRLCVCARLSACVRLSLCVHKFVLCRVELEPSPTPVCFTCISMKQEVIYPSIAASLSLSLSPSLSLSQSNRHWSLCQARWPTVLLSSSKVSALPFICTWERPWPHAPLPCSSTLHVDLTSPVSSPVCVRVSVCVFVWLSKCAHRVDTCVHAQWACACGRVGVCIYVRVCDCSSVSGRMCLSSSQCLCSPVGVCDSV